MVTAPRLLLLLLGPGCAPVSAALDDTAAPDTAHTPGDSGTDSGPGPDSGPDTGTDSGDPSDTGDPGPLVYDVYACPDGVGDVDTITEAVAVVPDGGRIAVCNARFGEFLLIERPMTIFSTTGGDTTWLEGDDNGTGTLVTVRGAAVSIEGITLRGAGMAAVVEDGELTLRDLVVRENRAPGRDGAVVGAVRSRLAVHGAWFRDDEGTVTVRAVESELEVHGTLFDDDLGGFGSAVELVGGTLVARSTRFRGDSSGVTIREGSAELTNDTWLVADGATAIAGTTGVAEVSLLNSVIVGVEGNTYGVIASSPEVRYSVLYNLEASLCTPNCGPPAGEGVFEADPLLDTWDLGLGAGSPGVDAGDPAAAWNDVDGSRNDLGWEGGPYAR